MRTDLCDVFGIDYPIFAFTPSEHVAAAVSRAGGLGVLGCVRFNDPEQLEQTLTWMDENTDGKPYGVDVVMPQKSLDVHGSDRAALVGQIQSMIDQEHWDFVQELMERFDLPPLPEGTQAGGVVGWTEDVARDLVGCTIRHGETAGMIVETEAYHESEPACHAYVGRTARTVPLFGRAGTAYVYFSYGMHALLNVVCEREGVGAAVLIRALEPIDGIELMRERRGPVRDEDLCSGPGKLTQALGIGLSLNGSSLVDGSIEVLTREPGSREPRIVIGERIGITKAADLPWRFCDADSRHVSRPWPAAMRRAA